MPDYRFVDLKLDQSLPTLVPDRQRIGVDTEFMRERTFFAQLCLVQISTGSEIFCADPLNLDHADNALTDALWKALMKPQWILHSARQDIEVIFQTTRQMPREIFDTQIAAALLGYQPQMGYANLVTELFEVELAKTHTRADWSKRPLSDSVLSYAAEDVEYLLPAHEILTERLDKLGRLDWAFEDSAQLLDVSLYEPDPALAIDRLKGARNLQGRSRAAAAGLAIWREREAIRANRPRQWIMRDQMLIDVAMARPEDLKDLARIDGLPESTIRRAGDQLLTIVADATHDESGYRPPDRPDENQKSLLKKMQKVVVSRAEELGISTEIVAPKKELSAAMLGQTESRVFRGWRRSVVGEALLELLDRS
jgi:ribonuclease D